MLDRREQRGRLGRRGCLVLQGRPGCKGFQGRLGRKPRAQPSHRRNRAARASRRDRSYRATGPQGLRDWTGWRSAAGSGTGLNYQGTYASTANYALDDVAVYQGSSYVSLIAGNDREHSGVESGGVGAAGCRRGAAGTGSQTVAVSYRGVYASTTNYVLNDIVLYGASSYISLIASNTGNSPALSPADHWGLLAEGGTGIGLAGPAGPAGPTGPQGPPGLGYQGAYASSSNYALSDVVEYQGLSYISLSDGNHGNTPPLSPSQWGLPASAQAGAPEPQGLQDSHIKGATPRPPMTALGDVAVWQGSSYTSLIAGNHGNTPSLSPQQWGPLTAQGPAGPTGATGATGTQGPQGMPGSVGPNGADRDRRGIRGLPGRLARRGFQEQPARRV